MGEWVWQWMRERAPVIKHSLAVGRVTVWAGGGERERERNISHLCVYSLYSVRKAGNRETGCMMSSRGIFTDGMRSLQEMSTLWLPSLMILSDLWRPRSEHAFPPEESVSRVSFPSQTDRVNWRRCQSSAPKNKDLKNAGVPLSALTASALLLVRTAGQVCVGGCVFLWPALIFFFCVSERGASARAFGLLKPLNRLFSLRELICFSLPQTNISMGHAS